MRKIFGVLLILLAIFLSFALLLVIIQLFLNKDSSLPSDGGAHALGYILGKFIGMAIFALLNFALYFFGYRLLKKNKKKLAPISDEHFPSQLK